MAYNIRRDNTGVPLKVYGQTTLAASLSGIAKLSSGTVGTATAGTDFGTVNSVTFTGDGILDSSTPSTAVISSGTVIATPLTQSANKILAGPTTGSAAAPTFRSLVSADIPNNAANTTGTASNIMGTAAVVNGGTGLTSITSGDLLIGNGTSALTLLAPGTGVAIGVATATNSGSGFETRTDADGRYEQLSGNQTITGLQTFSYNDNSFATISFKNTNTGADAIAGFGLYDSSANEHGSFVYVNSSSPVTALRNSVALTSNDGSTLALNAAADSGTGTAIDFISSNATGPVLVLKGSTQHMLFGTTTDNSSGAIAQFTGTVSSSSLTGGGMVYSTTGGVLANALSGQATLSSGSVTVSNGAILATSKVAFSVTSASYSGTTGAIIPVVASGSVTFHSTNGSDVSVINYAITP